jgi:glycosyltransferase involved in cell wall biosynthesis
MPPITALLHTKNDALRLGRALEMLLPCTDIVIVDHHSTDATLRVARQYGARVVTADAHPAADHYLDLARHDWILCLDPAESISEGLQASLFEWSVSPVQPNISGAANGSAFSVFVRQQTSEGWLQLPAPETRLIPRGWTRWEGRLPAREPSAVALQGELLRFASL